VSFAEIIARKRDGLKLREDEVAAFVRGASRGTVPPEQLAALLMAVYCQGMDEEETRWLTREMLSSGARWDLRRDRPDAVDKHSTGGVGDTVSLILAPLLAAVGVPVAMMAGRGLGHSQGTLDKVEAIPGFRCRWDRDGALALLDRCGVAVLEQSEEIVPADRALYALRDVTSTVGSLPLIVASIMSKKLALGAGTLVLDVKWGSGAFRGSVAEARELALALRGVGRESGIAVEAVLTDMNQPLGPALGTACEVRAAVDVLTGEGGAGLREVTLRLAEEALTLRGWDRAAAGAALTGALDRGQALAAWERVVEAHGGTPDPGALPVSAREVPVLAQGGGWLAAVDGVALGRAAVELGAGRRQRDEALAHGAGLLVHARLGDRVEPGQPLATLLVGEREVELEDVAQRVEEAFVIGAAQVEPPELIIGTVRPVAGSVGEES